MFFSTDKDVVVKKKNKVFQLKVERSRNLIDNQIISSYRY